MNSIRRDHSADMGSWAGNDGEGGCYDSGYSGTDSGSLSGSSGGSGSGDGDRKF